MSDVPAPPARSTSVLATTIGVGGFLAFVIGILILVWPGRTAMVVGALISVYAIVAGIIYFALGVFGSARRGWARVGAVALGVVFVAAGVVALFHLTRTTEWLAVFLGILVGLLTIIEGAAVLTTIHEAASKGWSIVYAVLSIIAGVVLLFAPVWGVLVLWWILALTLVVLGIVNVVRALRMRRGRS